MEKSELYIPLGSLSLTKEQSEQLKLAGGWAVSQLQIYSVVALAAEDQVFPVYGVPGLEAIIFHHEMRPQPEDAIGGQSMIAALLSEVAAGGASRPFAAHTKLVAPKVAPDQDKEAKGNKPSKS